MVFRSSGCFASDAPRPTLLVRHFNSRLCHSSRSPDLNWRTLPTTNKVASKDLRTTQFYITSPCVPLYKRQPLFDDMSVHSTTTIAPDGDAPNWNTGQLGLMHLEDRSFSVRQSGVPNSEYSQDRKRMRTEQTSKRRTWMRTDTSSWWNDCPVRHDERWHR